MQPSTRVYIWSSTRVSVKDLSTKSTIVWAEEISMAVSVCRLPELKLLAPLHLTIHFCQLSMGVEGILGLRLVRLCFEQVNQKCDISLVLRTTKTKLFFSYLIIHHGSDQSIYQSKMDWVILCQYNHQKILNMYTSIFIEDLKPKGQ